MDKDSDLNRWHILDILAMTYCRCPIRRDHCRGDAI